MRNLKLTLQYDGTNYCGWQIQQNRNQKPEYRNPKTSIQGKIEEALYKTLREKVRVVGSGRTDAGVHALGQVANFKTQSKLSAKDIAHALNSYLPQDIRIINCQEVSLDFHSQFWVKSKVYNYIVLNSKLRSPILEKYVARISYPLNISLMRQESKVLCGRHDFKSFCTSNSGARSTVRHIKKIEVKTDKRLFSWLLPPGAKLVIISIEADGLLYNMVRNISGTLIDIARGYLKKADMCKILKARNRSCAGATAAARGLYLVEVKYQ